MRVGNGTGEGTRNEREEQGRRDGKGKREEEVQKRAEERKER